MHVASFARILTGCNMQDGIKFKVRIFGRPYEGYGFIHITLSLVSAIETATEALVLLHSMKKRRAYVPCP